MSIILTFVQKRKLLIGSLKANVIIFGQCFSAVIAAPVFIYHRHADATKEPLALKQQITVCVMLAMAKQEKSFSVMNSLFMFNKNQMILLKKHSTIL